MADAMLWWSTALLMTEEQSLITPDWVFADDFPARRYWTGEQKLAARMLLQAVADGCSWAARDEEHRLSAQRWLLLDGGDAYLPAASACAALGLDLAAVRKAVRRKWEAERPLALTGKERRLHMHTLTRRAPWVPPALRVRRRRCVAL